MQRGIKGAWVVQSFFFWGVLLSWAGVAGRGATSPEMEGRHTRAARQVVLAAGLDGPPLLQAALPHHAVPRAIACKGSCALQEEGWKRKKEK